MWETVLTITVIATLAMISPGPDFVLVVKNAARYSRRAALAPRWASIWALPCT